jgi:hypothetical protein
MTFNGRTEASALVDNSSSGIATTAVGSPTYEPTGALIVSDGGVQYNASYATLDGSSQYYTLADSGDDFTDFSFFFRFSTLTTTSAERILSCSSNTMILDLRDTNKILWAEGVQTAQFNTTDIFDGNHHVIGITGTGTTLKWYVDGVNVQTDTITPISTKNFEASIGSKNGIDGFYEGSLAFVYFTRSVLTDQYISEISQTYAKCFGDLSSGLQSEITNNGSCWNLGTWTGSNEPTTDQTDNGNTLTAVGSPTYESELAVECDEDPV